MAGKNRELNVFGLSLLDVMCGALGAFIFLFITVVSQNAESTKPLDQAERERFEQMEEEIEELKKQRGSAQEERDILQTMGVTMHWDTPNVDMDLWIRTPEGEWWGPKVEFRKGIKTARRITESWEGPGWESYTLNRMRPGVWYICYRMQSRQKPNTIALVGGYLFANFSKEYQQIWMLGNRSVYEEGKLYLWMKFENKDGKLVHETLIEDEIQELEAAFNSEGAGPPQELWLPGEMEKWQAEKLRAAEEQKLAREERVRRWKSKHPG